MRFMMFVLLGLAATVAVISGQSNRPMLTGEINHTRFPGGHAETFKLSQDAWVSKNGNWRAGGYVQHDREKFGGMRHSNTHGGISITGRFRRMAEPQDNRPMFTAEASHTRFPGGHAETYKINQDAWVSKDGNWRAGGYVQHDREKYGGMRQSNTHGGISISGRFRRMAEPQDNRPMLTAEASHTKFPGGHAETYKINQDAWVSKDGNWRAGGYVQHDREKYGGMRQSNTHGGISISGRFRRMAEPQDNRPMLTAEASHTRFPGGHAETYKINQDAWVSKDGNWKAGGYVQHDREKFGGMRHSNTHGGISISGRFRRMAEPQDNRPMLTGEISHTRFPGGHAETFKLNQDAWVSRNGNWRAGGYVQHDRERFGNMRHSNTHGGISITGRFRRMAEPQAADELIQPSS